MPRFVLLGTLLPAWAAASPLPTIAVVGLHQEALTPDQQRRGAAEIVAEIDETAFFRGRMLTDLEPFLRGREALILEDAFLGPGRALVDDGRVLFNGAQPADAVPVLEDAVQALRAAMVTAPSTRELWDAWFLLGAARLEIGLEVEARAAFAAAAALSPLRTPDAARFPPTLVEHYETVRRERTQLGSTLTIEADERDTAIWLNGEPRGVVPLTLHNVLPGENFVHARSPKGFFAFQPVSIPEAGRRTATLRLGDPPLGVPEESRVARSRQIGGLYRAFGRRAGVDLVLIGGTMGEELLLQLYSPRTDGFSQSLSIPYTGSAVDEALEALPELLAGVTREGTFEADYRTAVAVPLVAGSNRWLARSLTLSDVDAVPQPTRTGLPRWARWTLVGVGAAAVLGGTAAGVHYATLDPHQGAVIVLPP